MSQKSHILNHAIYIIIIIIIMYIYIYPIMAQFTHHRKTRYFLVAKMHFSWHLAT